MPLDCGNKCQGDCTPGPACTDHLEGRLITSRVHKMAQPRATGGQKKDVIPIAPTDKASAISCFSLSVSGVLGLTLRLDIVSQAVVVSVL